MNIEVSKSLEFNPALIEDCGHDKELAQSVADLAAKKAYENALEAIDNAYSLRKYMSEKRLVLKVSVCLSSTNDEADDE